MIVEEPRLHCQQLLVALNNFLFMLPYSRQSITEDDIQAVAKVMRSAHLTQGFRGESIRKCFIPNLFQQNTQLSAPAELQLCTLLMLA